MKPVLTLDLETLTPRMEMPVGLIGQISLHRLMRQLAKAGEFKPGERPTHVSIFPDGTMQFRIETD